MARLDRRLERAAGRLAASLGPVSRRLHALGDRARDGLLDAVLTGEREDHRPLLETWRRLDLVGGEESRDE